MTAIAVLILATVCLGAWLYVQRARHPRTRPLAAYLIFLTVFCTIAVAGYVVIGTVLTVLDRPTLVENPIFGVVLLAATLVPAFVVARRQIRRPSLADDRYGPV